MVLYQHGIPLQESNALLVIHWHRSVRMSDLNTWICIPTTLPWESPSDHQEQEFRAMVATCRAVGSWGAAAGEVISSNYPSVMMVNAWWLLMAGFIYTMVNDGWVIGSVMAHKLLMMAIDGWWTMVASGLNSMISTWWSAMVASGFMFQCQPNYIQIGPNWSSIII